MKGRFPFSPKFRKFRLEMERTSSVRSVWNIWEHLWRWSTLTGPVISVGPTELSLSILTELFSLVPLFCILLTRTITRRAVAWVGFVQMECTVPLGTWALVEWKAPEMSNFDGPLTYQVRPGNGPSLDPSKRKFLSFVWPSWLQRLLKRQVLRRDQDQTSHITLDLA